MKPEDSRTYQNFAKLMQWCDDCTKMKVHQCGLSQADGNRHRLRRNRHRPLPHGTHVLLKGTGSTSSVK